MSLRGYLKTKGKFGVYLDCVCKPALTLIKNTFRDIPPLLGRGGSDKLVYREKGRQPLLLHEVGGYVLIPVQLFVFNTLDYIYVHAYCGGGSNRETAFILSVWESSSKVLRKARARVLFLL